MSMDMAKLLTFMGLPIVGLFVEIKMVIVEQIGSGVGWSWGWFLGKKLSNRCKPLTAF